MRRYAMMVLTLLLLHKPSNAQVPNVDITFKESMITQKAKYYQQFMLHEQQQRANQEAYDVKYYSLDLIPDPTTSVLGGIVGVVGEITATTLDRVEMNFWDGMSITDIHRSGSPGSQLQYDRSNDILTVHLDRTYTQGEQFRIIVVYNGRPGDSEYRSFNFDTYNGEPMIWTMSSVFGARGWWPCKDVPSDKPDSVDIRVTVPSDLIVASNGALRESTIENNRTTYWWHEGYPIATYLVSLAIYHYEVHYEHYVYNSGADTMKVHFYSFPGNYEQHSEINASVKDMIAFFADSFGEYPFVDEKYGQADFLWGGGMEHQTCTSYGNWNEALFAHEIAHQWWGDMITCDSFHHIWLNEGFASYGESLWFEHAYPPFTASEYQMKYQFYLGPGTVIVEDPQTENIFDSGLSYVKGSWVLHMLRHVVGDSVFFDILKAYYDSPEHKYGTATTEGFRVICEKASGLDLDKFFHQWIYEEGYPQYSYLWNWNQRGSKYVVDLEIKQEQEGPQFWMPIDIAVTTAGGQTTYVVWDSLATQSFRLTLSSEPIDIELDKNDWILKKIKESFVNPTFDQGILLVNGVSFDVYGSEIWNAYENHAFWGDYPVSFWDCFDTPQSGYPSTLPEPLGHGRLSADILGQFSTVIWVGNNYAGDLGRWQQASIMPYLEAGGNVILMSCKGQDYINSELKQYLGITWAENVQNTVRNCISAYPGLENMLLTGDQTSNAVFDTILTNNESVLLFRETASFGRPRGLGVWHKPAAGGTYRRDGGSLVFISGRPYRYDSSQLQSNVEFILQNFFRESKSPGVSPTVLTLYQNYPNPFNRTTIIEYDLAEETKVILNIYNLRGQKIRSVVNKKQAMGLKSVTWDGTDDNGKAVSSGIYVYGVQVRNSDVTGHVKKMLLLR